MEILVRNVEDPMWNIRHQGQSQQDRFPGTLRQVDEPTGPWGLSSILSCPREKGLQGDGDVQGLCSMIAEEGECPRG